jgi:hypothetical protein
MAKMREVKVTKPGSTVGKKPAPATNSYINADGVKVTIIKPRAVPKLLTARCKG